MALFDRQPMGPIPARRPMNIGQDPESAEAGIRSDDDPQMRTPRLLAIGIVVAVIGCAHLTFRHLAGRR